MMLHAGASETLHKRENPKTRVNTKDSCSPPIRALIRLYDSAWSSKNKPVPIKKPNVALNTRGFAREK